MQAEFLGGAVVDRGGGFVGFEVFGGENVGPGEAGVFGHVFEEVEVLVGEGAGLETFVELFQSG